MVTGGGDGTVAHTISEVLQRREERGYAHCPRFAVLKLGTGNAVADFLGAQRYQDDLQNIDSTNYRWLDPENQTASYVRWYRLGRIYSNHDNMRRVADRFAPTRAAFKTVAGYLAAES